MMADDPDFHEKAVKIIGHEKRQPRSTMEDFEEIADLSNIDEDFSDLPSLSVDDDDEDDEAPRQRCFRFTGATPDA
jgi:hypothetical protein